MDTLSYRIAPEIFAAHPDFRLGVVVFDGVDNRRDGSALASLLAQAHESVRASVRGNVAEHPAIAAWREAFRRFGAKPSEHRSSIEAMVRRVLQPAAIPSINPLVDIGNIVSLRYLMPVGVHPWMAGSRSLAVRHAQAGDTFTAIEGEPAETPPAGEVVLAADNEVLTRRWTWRQAAGTRIQSDTSRIFMNLDGLPPVRKQDVMGAMSLAIDLVRSHCGGELGHQVILDATHPEFTLKLGRGDG
jgi:DNA/RNA-binding domain of Phe-tRNA-synthetase-like protein